jgi:hypothetical protein
MAAKHKMTVSVEPPKQRPTSTERRKAANAAIANKQQDLKAEAAARRAARERDRG